MSAKGSFLRPHDRGICASPSSDRPTDASLAFIVSVGVVVGNGDGLSRAVLLRAPRVLLVAALGRSLDQSDAFDTLR